jgi:hypothetical protein
MAYRTDEIRADANAEALSRLRAEAAARRTLDAEQARADMQAAWARSEARAPKPAEALKAGHQQAARTQMIRSTSPGWTPPAPISGATAERAAEVWRADSAASASPTSGAAAARARMLRRLPR